MWTNEFVCRQTVGKEQKWEESNVLLNLQPKVWWTGICNASRETAGFEGKQFFFFGKGLYFMKNLQGRSKLKYNVKLNYIKIKEWWKNFSQGDGYINTHFNPFYISLHAEKFFTIQK